MGDFSADDVLEDPQHEEYDDLPVEITIASEKNDVEKVLNWLGPDDRISKISKRRLNAKNPKKLFRTLLHEAEFECHAGLMYILLQRGADVDPKRSYGTTPLYQACTKKELDPSARLLLECGAEIGDNFCALARQAGNQKLAKLMSSPIVGRRCEIVGLSPGNTSQWLHVRHKEVFS